MKLTKPLILASRSPRRILLLKQIGLDVQVVPCSIPEDFHDASSPEQNARTLAVMKARCVAGSFSNAVVLGADTIVAIDGEMLGKPIDGRDAVRMLSLLSGKTHTVYTGFALIDRPSDSLLVDVEATRVTFRELPLPEIEEYVKGGSPMDKAGAYGIQDDYGAVFVSRIEGCFYNVMGLPLAKVYMRLCEMGVVQL